MKAFKTVKEIFSILALIAKTAPRYFVISVLTAVLKTVIPIGNSFAVSVLVYYVTNDLRLKHILLILVTLAVFNLVLGIASVFAEKKLTVCKEGFKDDFKLKIMKDILELKYSHLENPQTLDLKERALRPLLDYGVLERLLSEILPSVINSAVLLVSTVTVISAFSAVLLIPITIFTAVDFLLINKSKQIKDNVYKHILPVERKISYYDDLTLNFSYGKDIRLYHMENDIMKKIRRLNDEELKSVTRQFRYIGTSNAVISVISQIQVFIIYLFAGFKFFKGLITVADFTFFTGVCVNFAQAYKSFLEQCAEIYYINKFFSGYREFAAIIASERQEPYSPKETVETIEFKNVSFKYPNTKKLILNNCSFKINKNEHIALVGLNGEGKTTVVKLLCGFFKPDCGEILINGKAVTNPLMNISAVFQDFKLFAFTVKENIILACDHNENAFNELTKTELLSFIKDLPAQENTFLYKSFNDGGVELSGGQGQRIAIARAIYKDASFIVLDEPTAALDPRSENYLYRQFMEITENKTALYISHHLSSTYFCDRILVLKDGKISENGSHEQLMERCGDYAEMFSKQAEFFGD
ncbi:MAG: ABC transporter ATP-binding protein [Ruminococcaceae bacterium]|nr:ABC transporter ATP-binding protein [Oscillospiraceae bacterium]